MEEFIKKHFWIPSSIIFLIFLFPFVSPLIATWAHFSFGELYTFGIDNPKDFYAVWIALFSIGGIAINIQQNQKRFNNQEQQLDLQTKVQRDNRFAKGIELLGNNNESARIGAAYSLYFLAKDFPEEFRKSTFEVLCAHIRAITTTPKYIEEHFSNTSTEIQSIIDLLFKQTKQGSENSLFKELEANLLHVNFAYADLSFTDFTGANLSFANLSHTHLRGTNFSNVRFFKTNLSYIDGRGGGIFKEAVIGDTNLCHANLSNCDFSNAILTNVEICNNTIFYETIFMDAQIKETDLEKACFQEAILEGITFNNVTNIVHTNFQGAYGLDQIRLMGNCEDEIKLNTTHRASTWVTS